MKEFLLMLARGFVSSGYQIYCIAKKYGSTYTKLLTYFFAAACFALSSFFHTASYFFQKVLDALAIVSGDGGISSAMVPGSVGGDILLSINTFVPLQEMIGHLSIIFLTVNAFLLAKVVLWSIDFVIKLIPGT